MREREYIRTMVVLGTRPEAIKMAPVIGVFDADPRIHNKTVATGQHREMLDQVMSQFNIRPDYDLNIMRHGQSLTDVAVRCLTGLEEILVAERPDVVLVHGDTLTSFVAGLAAFFQKIPVGHVEAGLRTYDMYNPFPEEMNRRLTGRIATLHFAPTARARANLIAEGVQEDSIYLVGNTVVDALRSQVSDDFAFTDPALKNLDFDSKRVLLLTTHRRENLGEPMRRIFEAVRTSLKLATDIEVVFPMHRNQSVRRLAEEVLGHVERVHLIDPPDYATFANLLARSYLVLTDSGGIQEEAPGLGIPSLVLRDTTERPEGIIAGTTRLVGTDFESILSSIKELVESPEAYARMSRAINPYGDGLASDRIKQALLYHFNMTQLRPHEYNP